MSPMTDASVCWAVMNDGQPAEVHRLLSVLGAVDITSGRDQVVSVVSTDVNDQVGRTLNVSRGWLLAVTGTPPSGGVLRKKDSSQERNERTLLRTKVP